MVLMNLFIFMVKFANMTITAQKMSLYEDFQENTVFSSIRTEYGNLPSKSPYSV